MSKFIAGAKKFYQGEEAATMVEYGLMLALIAVACILAATFLGDAVSGLFTEVGASVNTVDGTAN